MAEDTRHDETSAIICITGGSYRMPGMFRINDSGQRQQEVGGIEEDRLKQVGGFRCVARLILAKSGGS